MDATDNAFGSQDQIIHHGMKPESGTTPNASISLAVSPYEFRV
jgi:hypothetical protein